MRRVRVLAVFNLLTFIGHVALAYAIQFRLINRAGVAEVANRYESLFTPAGITFSIWGVIYTILFAFCVFHLIVAFTKPLAHPVNEDLGRIGPWFILNNLATIGWLITWTDNNIQADTILIIIQLITLMIIHIRLGLHDPYAGFASKIFTSLPLSIYFGWITIATIANISIYLVSINWDGFGWGYSTVTWTQFMIGLAVLITIVTVLVQRNVFFGLVVIWALYGIVMKRESIDAAEYSAIIQAAWIGIGVVSITCLIQLVNNLSKKRKTEKFLIIHKRKGVENLQ